jgi:hypothetical protein
MGASKKVAMAKKSNRAKTPAAAATLTQLLSTKQSSKKLHGKSSNTTDAYERRIKQANAWLQEQLKAEAALEHPAGCPETAQPSQDWTLDDLAHAFDRKPNCASPSAIALFIAWKCFDGDLLKRGVAEQTHAAFKKFWEDACVLLEISFLGTYISSSETQTAHITAVGTGIKRIILLGGIQPVHPRWKKWSGLSKCVTKLMESVIIPLPCPRSTWTVLLNGPRRNAQWIFLRPCTLTKTFPSSELSSPNIS